ncbi:sensor histidine kinase [Lichenicoccus sp.]|uniref:sensor histidine kinase n=1 Tax=Lichenicoccus sp. TaxID=2781899 RepID=UPI003D0CDB88
MSGRASAVAALLLFGCGALACLAWSWHLFASGFVMLLAALWVAIVMLRQERRLAAAPAPAPPHEAAWLAETERRQLRAMLDQTPAALLMIAGDGAVRAVNRAARRLFATDDRISSLPPSIGDALERIRPGQRTVLKLSVDKSSEQARSYALSIASSTGAGGMLRLAILTDIEAELQVAEAQAAQDLLQVLGHEIMNSLTPVTSLAESANALLADGGPEQLAQARDALETILRRASGLERFVRDYRRLARLPPPDLQPASIAALLQHAGDLFRSRWPEVQLTLCLPEPDLVARLDADQLAQALLNLLANAADAAINGSARPPWVTLDGSAQGDGVAIRVTDSGDGIAPGLEETIFQPFQSGRPDGTGIGLGLARQIARLHGGALLLLPPTPDHGASFLLTL